MNEYFNYVYHWITEASRENEIRGVTVKVKIQELLDSLPSPRDGITVYRGQEFKSTKIFPGRWFSTSSDLQKVLRQHIQERENCCLFKIHVYPGIKRFAVNDIVTVNKAKNFDESEIIVNGNGVFYKDPLLEEEGFDEIGSTKGIRTFETWYSLPREKPVKKNININNIIARNAAARRSATAKKVPKRVINADTLFNRVNPEEYYLYETVDSLKNMGVHLNKNEEATNETWEEVFQRIQEAQRQTKEKKGGSRKARKTRKARRKTRKSKP